MKLPTYERHPLSAEYDDIEGKAWDDFVQGVREHGVINGRKIVLHDGKILDGWQLYRACVEIGAEVEFKTLADGIDPEEFVSTVNDRRRHETQKQALARVSKRRERVAELRAEGKSLRAIADETGTSEMQVRRDLEAAEEDSGATPVAPETPPKIVGKDGKKYDLPKKPARKRKDKECERCRRNGGATCPQCLEMRMPKKPDLLDEEPEEPPTIDDQIKEANRVLESWCRGLMKYLDTLPADPWLNDLNRKETVAAKFRSICETVRSAKCSKACPKCEGVGCSKCHNSGRVTPYAMQQMGAA